MDIKVGDKVKFLSDTGGGIVVQILRDRQALVRIEDDFEIPVMISDLVVTESAGSKTIEMKPVSQIKENKPEKPIVSTKAALKDIEYSGPVLAILPVGDKLDSDTVFECHMINDGDNFFAYTFAVEKFEGLQLVQKGDLEPGMKVKVARYEYSELVKISAFYIDMIFYDEGAYKPIKPIQFVFNTKSINLSKSILYKQNDYFYEDALIVQINDNTTNLYNINDKSLNKAAKEKNDISVKKEVKPQNPDIEEVDLHIEEIIDDFETLSNGEILNLQMSRFITALEGALLGKTKRIVFIHGVGNGILRYEIQKTLKSKYSNLQFHDASFAEYGFGATMVIVR
jgi:hypothetical protein